MPATGRGVAERMAARPGADGESTGWAWVTIAGAEVGAEVAAAATEPGAAIGLAIEGAWVVPPGRA